MRLHLSIVVLLLAQPACAVEPLGTIGRSCAADQPCGPGARCDPSTSRCVPDDALDAAPDACADGQLHCGGSCVDTATDHRHCGGCGKACAAGLDCVAGTCVCGAGRCAGCCVGGRCVPLKDQTTQRCGAAGASCQACDDGITCTTDACIDGVCSGKPDPGHCLIQGACIADKSVDPAHPCQRCESATSPYGWAFFLAPGCVETVAGSSNGFKDGPALQAQFDNLSGLALDAAGAVYVADTGNNVVRKVEAGLVSTVAGDSTYGYKDGPASKARFNEPGDVAVGAGGKVYVADTKNHVIRLIHKGVVSTIAGAGGLSGYKDGPVAVARFNKPRGLALDAAGTLYVADRDNQRVRTIAGGVVSTLAGDGTVGHRDGPAKSAWFTAPREIDLGPKGSAVYVVDPADNRVRKIEGGVVTTVAGSGSSGYQDGPATSATFDQPWGLVVTAAGDLIIADTENHVLRKISGGLVSTVVGTGLKGLLDGPALKAALSRPLSLVRSPSGQILFGQGSHLRRYLP